MPCDCGQKVDRSTQAKIKCILCNELLHISCCKIKSAELQFIKNSFKCQVCLNKRRASLSSSPVLPLPNCSIASVVNARRSSSSESTALLNAVAASTDNVCLNSNTLMDVSTSTASAAGVLLSSLECSSVSSLCDVVPTLHINASNLNASTATLTGESNVLLQTPPTQLLNNECASTGLEIANCITLEMLFKEIVALRKQNTSLHDCVDALRKSNDKLLEKVNALEATVREGQLCVLDLHNNRAKSITNADVADPVLNLKKQFTVSQEEKKLQQLNLCNTALNVNVNNDSANMLTVNAPSYAAVVGPAVPSPVSGFALTSTSKRPSAVCPVATTDNELNRNSVSASPTVPNWMTVHKKRKKVAALVGENDNNELSVFARFKWFHLSSFKPSVSCDETVDYNY